MPAQTQPHPLLEAAVTAVLTLSCRTASWILRRRAALIPGAIPSAIPGAIRNAPPSAAPAAAFP